MGDFTLSGGTRSSYYIDARRATMSAEGQSLIGALGFRTVREADAGVSWVGGLTLGADPIAYAIAHRSWMERDPVNAFTVRKEAKTHGLGRRIEGGLPDGARVIVIEDTITSGASALRAVDVLEERSCDVRAILTLIDREEGGALRIRDRGYRLVSLFRAAELLQTRQTQRTVRNGMTRQR